MVKTVLRPLFLGAAMMAMLNGHGEAAGLPDVLGIQLGMPAREAHAKLQAQIPKNPIQVTSTNLPTIEKPVVVSFQSVPKQAPAMGDEGDYVTVDVTLPPNKQAVWRVSREHFFANKGIPTTTLLASLREKYGKESQAMDGSGRATTDDKQVVSLLWLMDEQGRPSALPPSSIVASPSRICGTVNVESPPDMRFVSPENKWCLSSYTAVTVVLLQNGLVHELSDRMTVVAVSVPMGVRAGEVTKQWKEEIAQGQHREDLEKAKQQEKPKL